MVPRLLACFIFVVLSPVFAWADGPVTFTVRLNFYFEGSNIPWGILEAPYSGTWELTGGPDVLSTTPMEHASDPAAYVSNLSSLLLRYRPTGLNIWYRYRAIGSDSLDEWEAIGFPMGSVNITFLQEGYCRWCFDELTVGTHGNSFGTCNLPPPPLCPLCGVDLAVGSHGAGVCVPLHCTACGGNMGVCIHGEHTCPPGDGGGGIDDELLAIVYPLLVNLLTTVIVLQSVQVGVALATIFLAFFRDFLKSF